MKEAWKQLEEQLCLSESFDLVCRRLTAPSGEYRFYFVDGFIKDEIVEKLMEFLLTCDAPALPLAALQQELFPYVEVSMAKEAEAAALQVLSGVMTVCREEDSGYVLIDARTYPTRSMNEPEDDRVLRGSRDGFVETLVFNTALIRRRIRDRRLRMAHVQVGETKDDVVICSMAGCRDEALYETLKERLQTLNVHSLTMAQESLSEALLRKHWWNPFPIVRYTERPDVASAHVQEGGIALICDNSPSVALLPASLLDFAQEAQDYYFPPLIGTYLRFIRILVFLLAQFLTPLWFWFNCNPELYAAGDALYADRGQREPERVLAADPFGDRHRCHQAGQPQYAQFAERLFQHHRGAHPGRFLRCRQAGSTRRSSSIWRLWPWPTSPSQALSWAMRSS